MPASIGGEGFDQRTRFEHRRLLGRQPNKARYSLAHSSTEPLPPDFGAPLQGRMLPVSRPAIAVWVLTDLKLGTA